MNTVYIKLRRKNLIMAMWYDIKLAGKISKETRQIAKQIKRDIKNSPVLSSL